MATFCFALFLMLPAVVLALHAKRKIAPLWFLWLAYAPIGWILVNAGLHFYYESLQRLIDATPNPGEELSNSYANDAGRPFALLFGWAYGLVYFGIWVAPYWIIRALARRLSPARTQPGLL